MRKLLLHAIGLTVLCLYGVGCTPPEEPVTVNFFGDPVLVMGEEALFYVEIEPPSMTEQVTGVNMFGDKGIRCEQSEVDMLTWYCAGTREAKAATVFAEITGPFPNQTARYAVQVVAPTPALADMPMESLVTDTPTPTGTPTPTSTPTNTPTPTDAPTPTSTPTPQADAVVDAATLNLRAGPGTQYGIVGQLREGDALTVIGKNNEAGDWLQVVTAEGIEGWVSRQFLAVYVDLTKIPVAEAPPPPPSAHPIYEGMTLASGYDMGVNTSGGLAGWVTDVDGYMCMAYPGGQEWGAVFITVGEPRDPPRPSQDLSDYQTLSLELRGEVGGEQVWIGLKDNTDPDDGSEAKIRISDLTGEWQTYQFPLSRFRTADLHRLYVVIEFVFEPGTPAETVYFRNIQYLP